MTMKYKAFGYVAVFEKNGKIEMSQDILTRRSVAGFAEACFDGDQFVAFVPVSVEIEEASLTPVVEKIKAEVEDYKKCSNV